MIDGQGDATVPEREVESDVECSLHLPSQVWVGITDDAEGSDKASVHRYDTIRLDQLHRVVGSDAAQVARASVADAQFRIVDKRQRLHPLLLTDHPGTADGGEESPVVILAHL